jgi:hypothetical protein
LESSGVEGTEQKLQAENVPPVQEMLRNLINNRRNKMKKAVLIGAVLMLALPAMAQPAVELTWTVTPEGDMYKVIGTLTCNNGYNIQAIDGGITSAAVGGAAFYQYQMFGSVPSGSLDVMGIPVPADDTHFLFASVDMLIPPGFPLTEDNDLSVGGNYGWGTSLSGTFGIGPVAQGTSLDFIQIYATAGLFDYNFGVGTDPNPTTVFTGSVTVPEPTTIALLGLGAVGLLRRRRAA